MPKQTEKNQKDNKKNLLKNIKKASETNNIGNKLSDVENTELYQKVSPKLDFVSGEMEILDFWKKNNIFEKTLKQNENNKTFSYFEGPPTANGLPHAGHSLTQSIKDIVLRYKTMKGFYVPRKAGWDTHGLPVELEIEKEIGSSGKQDIEKFGVEKFTSLCKESVWKYKGLWESIGARIGFWIDLDNAYITYNNNYIESIFWALKKLFDKGLIYKGHRISPYCPRCGTALSKMEVEKNYKNVKENSVFVKFKSLEEENTYFLVWTTTPWTLLSNVAICMNPNEKYVKLESGGENYIVLENLADKLFENYKIVYSKLGKEFEFQKYEPLFDYHKSQFPAIDAFFVVVDDYVTLQDGSGIVHIAPAFGAEDFEVGQKYNLPILQMVDDNGKIVDDAYDFKGLLAKQADSPIIKRLIAENKHFKTEPIEHSYPHCWRCETPLLYYAKSAWFVKTTAFKNQMIKNNSDVFWIPETIKTGRMGNFLENNIDWGISRTRYWGTPLPFWECECGHIIAIGSVAELKERSGIKEINDLHKSELDKIEFKCEKCNGKMRRTPEVLDCWFDSGSMPFAQYHYPFENKEIFEKRFPADFICEGIDQTRGWFYTLQAVNTALFGKSPYKACMALGLVNDRFGIKMSKSKGNGIDPWNILNKEGADALRWYFYNTCNPGQGLSFNEDNLLELQRKFMGTLWNVYAFYVLYANIDNFNPTKYKLENCDLAFIDKWILSEFNALIKFIGDGLDLFNTLDTSRKITDFVDVLSNWYIRRSRDRYWTSGETEDKIAAFMTLYTILSELSKLIAPFVPFISERIYQNLVRNIKKNSPESVHLCEFPKANQKLINDELNIGMKKVLDIVFLGRSARNSANIKNRQPLSKIMVYSAGELNLSDELKDLIASELNVEKVEILSEAGNFITYELKPQLKILGPKFGKRIGEIKNYLQNLSADAAAEVVEKVKSDGSVKIKIGEGEQKEQIELFEQDLLIETKNKEGFVSESSGGLTIVLDAIITEDLFEKGVMREIVSKIQNLRKDSEFEVTDRIITKIYTDEKTAEIVKKFKDLISADTLTETLIVSLKENINSNDGYFKTEFEVNGKEIMVFVKTV
ncbi:MAG: isoleucine--tRNA ligase [Clostridia bacterium]|nr:isoleucine--tRNA ligase [Clostridia bacterium]